MMQEVNVDAILSMCFFPGSREGKVVAQNKLGDFDVNLDRLELFALNKRKLLICHSLPEKIDGSSVNHFLAERSGESTINCGCEATRWVET
jgi:hypothetical protein